MEDPFSLSPPASSRLSTFQHPLLIAAAVVIISAPTVYFLYGGPLAIIPPQAAKPLPEPKPETVSDSEISQVNFEVDPEQALIWGCWKMDYYGPRYLEINPDQSARLVSFPDMMAQLVVGTKMLSIRCQWHRNGDNIEFKLLEGTPAASFGYVTKTFGATLPYEFVSVTPTTLTFKDLSDGHHDVWTRVDAIPTTP